MSRDGLTVTMIFLAESANYGEGVGNITTLKKMTRGDYQQYSYISRKGVKIQSRAATELGQDTG